MTNPFTMYGPLAKKTFHHLNTLYTCWICNHISAHRFESQSFGIHIKNINPSWAIVTLHSLHKPCKDCASSTQNCEKPLYFHELWSLTGMFISIMYELLCLGDKLRTSTLTKFLARTQTSVVVVELPCRAFCFPEAGLARSPAAWRQSTPQRQTSYIGSHRSQRQCADTFCIRKVRQNGYCWNHSGWECIRNCLRHYYTNVY